MPLVFYVYFIYVMLLHMCSYILGEQFLCDMRKNNKGRKKRLSPEQVTELRNEFIRRNHEQRHSLRQFAKLKHIPHETLRRAITYNRETNPTGLKPYKYRTRAHAFKSEDDFTIWKAKRVPCATALLNSSYKQWVFQDEGNCDSNKTFNSSNNVFWKSPTDNTPVPVIVNSKFRNKENWVHFSVLFTYDRKISIDFYTTLDENVCDRSFICVCFLYIYSFTLYVLFIYIVYSPFTLCVLYVFTFCLCICYIYIGKAAMGETG